MRPLVTPLNLQQRRWKRAFFTSLAGVLLLLLLLPSLLTQLIRYQLPRMGLGQVEIGNIDLNLFRGKLLLEEVALYKSAARVFSLQRAEIDLSMLSLLERRLHLQSVVLEGLSLTVKQYGAEPLQVAGISLPSAVTQSPPATVTEEPMRWSFGVDTMTLHRSSIHVIHPQFTETLQLHTLSLGALAMWRPEYVTPASLRIGLREGEISFKAKSKPFASKPVHHLEIDIASLPLASFAKLAEPQLVGLEGRFSTKMRLQLQQDVSKRLSLSQQGSLSLMGLRLQSGNTIVAQQGFSWNGTTAMEDVADIEALRVKGDLKLNGAELLVAGKKEAALSLRGLSISGLELQGNRQLTLAEVTVESLQAEASRRKQGVTILGLPEAAPIPDKKEKIAKNEPSEPVGARPFQFRIERVSLSGDNRLTFNDQTVKPAFRHTITLTKGDFRHIDNTLPEQATTLRLTGKDDFYTTFSVEGETRPFAPQLAIDLKAKLSGFDMPPTSPYLAQLLGYRITTGQLDSDVAMQIENNNMKGELELRMNQLQLEAEDPARIEEFQSKTSLPLNTALSLLRDSNDNIKLKLPISGKLDDPQFALDDIINTALGTALKGASVSYLKLLLQPYGTLITVVQMAGKAAGHIQLDPVLFATASVDVTPEALPYLERISQLAEKKDINMRLCGFASTADLLALTGGKEKAIPLAGHPALERLAKQRAETIKSILVHRYGVSATQLFVCHPELERDENAISRVELSI